MTATALTWNDRLLDAEDLARFEAQEATLDAQIQGLSKRQQATAAVGKLGMDREAMALKLLAFLDNHPEAEAIGFSNDDEQPRGAAYIFFEVDFGDGLELGANDAAEHIQEDLNNMGRNQHLEFHEALIAQSPIGRDDAEDVMGTILGEDWLALRKEKLLRQAIPEAEDLSGARGPRL